MHRLTPYALRSIALAALLLLLWNPAFTRNVPATGSPLVLLDASLSMADSTQWTAALDTARALARGGVLWRFGAHVAAFDTGPPQDGASRLAPALSAAAARPGALIIVTDGEVDDAATIAPDLLARPRVVALPRPVRGDAFVAQVRAPQRVSATDTVRLEVTYGATGHVPAGDSATRLAVRLGRRMLLTRAVPLPDSGTLVTELAVAAAQLPAGPAVLEVRLEGAADDEPRDDARLAIVDVSPEPAAVVLAAPPGWDTRFVAGALADVARIPVQTFVRLGNVWRDGRTLRSVPRATVARAVQRARVVVEGRAGTAPGGIPRRTAVLTLAGPAGQDGDWYIASPPISPVGAALAGIDWSELPPASTLARVAVDSNASVVLRATLARRGPARPAVVLSERNGARHATIAVAGLWRWQLRGNASAVAYRTLVAALADWLLADDAPRRDHEQLVPETPVTANGLPLVWRWRGHDDPRDVPVRLTGAAGQWDDTLRFDASGRAELRLAPGIYRYARPGGGGQGVVAVETYSDEWRLRPAVLVSHAGAARGQRMLVGIRERWWAYVLVVAALLGEWAWRRREGLA